MSGHNTSIEVHVELDLPVADDDGHGTAWYQQETLARVEGKVEESAPAAVAPRS